MPNSQNLVILGSTGSIGQSTLAIVRINPWLKVFALTGNRNVAVMLQQIVEFKPAMVAMANRQAAIELQRQLKLQLPSNSVAVLSGNHALVELAQHHEAELIVAAIVGVNGLESTLAATDAGKKVLLANKESLVCAGNILMQSVRQNKAQLLPLDSEHNAIFQCLTNAMQRRCVSGESIADGVDKVILTASGGPLLNTDISQIADVTPQQACAHPNWSMGQKISVDSATMMNKGLEYIEACWLFGLPTSQVDVVIHPQSVIHSLVAYSDGSLLAQLGLSNMRIPISYALGWPHRIDSNVADFDLSKIATLNFQEVDYQRFPCFKLAIDSMVQGQGSSLAVNIANEVAVAAFLDGRIRFDQIYYFVAKNLEMNPLCEPNSIEEVRELCDNVRRYTTELLNNLA